MGRQLRNPSLTPSLEITVLVCESLVKPMYHGERRRRATEGLQCHISLASSHQLAIGHRRVNKHILTAFTSMESAQPRGLQDQQLVKCSRHHHPLMGHSSAVSSTSAVPRVSAWHALSAFILPLGCKISCGVSPVYHRHYHSTTQRKR